MNTGAEERARERLLDVALGEATGVATPPGLVERVLARLDAGVERAAAESRGRWRSAALVLAGLGATLWIAISHGADGQVGEATELSQDPIDDLPAPLRVESPADIPKDVRNLSLRMPRGGASDLAPLGELAALEQLELRGGGPIEAIAGMRDPGSFTLPAGVFAPLCRCPRLRALVLRYLPGFTAKHLEPLSEASLLRALTLDMPGITLTPELGGALVELPALGRLELIGVMIDRAGLRRLGEIEQLRELVLRNGTGLDGESLDVIAGMRQLRSLGLPGLDHPLLSRMRGGGGPARELLTPELLAKLPDLVELDLSTNPLRTEQVESLPRTLERLVIRNCWQPGPDLADALIAMPALDDLTLSSAVVPGADDAMLLHVLRGRLLQRLDLPDRPTPAVAEGLARQDRLRALRVAFTTPPGVDPDPLDLEFVAALPLLERLELFVDSRTARVALPGTDLQPLTRAKRLNRLVLTGWPEAEVERVRELVDERVTIVAR